MIKPKVGFPVLYKSSSGKFCPAVICCVYSDTRINIGGFTEHGQTFAHTSVVLNHGDEECQTGEAQYNPAYTEEQAAIETKDANETKQEDLSPNDIANDEIETDSPEAAELDHGDSGE